MIYLAWVLASLFIIFIFVPIIGALICGGSGSYKNCFAAGWFIIGIILAAAAVFWAIFFLYKEYGVVL